MTKRKKFYFYIKKDLIILNLILLINNIVAQFKFNIFIMIQIFYAIIIEAKLKSKRLYVKLK